MSRIPRWVHPNHLTITRALLLVPLVLASSVLSLLSRASAIPFALMTIVFISSMCDLFDGPLARFRGVESNDGGMLDTVCDKIFILGALWSVCIRSVAFWQIVLVTVIEVLLMAVRLVKPSKPGSTFAKAPGAVKVWLQSIGILVALTESGWSKVVSPFIFVGAIIAGVLSLVFHLRDFSGSTERA
ncbi:MAG: CDP-alcohol phosphatidyltransferase family protein [bacterium]|nr:CDP-alcohol phosphatidyltransferase family protein [bacterium]